MPEGYQTLKPLIGDSMRVLEAKILLSLANGAGGGGGGGGGITQVAQTYAATAGTNPTGILASRGATDVAINTTDGSIYWYFSGAWTP